MNRRIRLVLVGPPKNLQINSQRTSTGTEPSQFYLRKTKMPPTIDIQFKADEIMPKGQIPDEMGL